MGNVIWICAYCLTESNKSGICENCKQYDRTMWLEKKKQARGKKKTIKQGFVSASFRLRITEAQNDELQLMTPEERTDFLAGKTQPKKRKKTKKRNRISVTIDAELEQILSTPTNGFSKAEYAAYLMKMEGRRAKQAKLDLAIQSQALKQHEERLNSGNTNGNQ